MAGFARAGVVAFFSNFGSMTGSSSAYTEREVLVRWIVAVCNSVKISRDDFPSPLDIRRFPLLRRTFDVAMCAGMIIFPQNITCRMYDCPLTQHKFKSMSHLTSIATSSESQNPSPAISTALEAHLNSGLKLKVYQELENCFK